MAKEQFDYERIEWIPPSWAISGTHDSVIAYSVMPKESIYIIKRFLPPTETGIWNKKTEEYRTGTRRQPPQYFMEIRDHAGVKVLRKHRLALEEAYVEWQDADYQVMDVETAFPGHPELLVMRRDNPQTRSRHEKIAQSFWQGESKSYSSSNMISYGDKLFSYNTIIMQRLPDGKVVENRTGYSSSTAGQQATARRFGKADYVVYGVNYNAQDLRPYLERKHLIATSMVGREKVDIVMVKRPPAQSYYDYAGGISYYIEMGGIYKGYEELTPKKAYIEYLDADRRLMPFAEAFPGNPELASMKRKYANPALGKKHWFYPFAGWHRAGTLLLAQSKLENGRNEAVNLYRTLQGRYFIEVVILDRNDVPLGGRIQYISRRRAMVEFRDADKRLVTHREAFK